MNFFNLAPSKQAHFFDGLESYIEDNASPEVNDYMTQLKMKTINTLDFLEDDVSETANDADKIMKEIAQEAICRAKKVATTDDDSILESSAYRFAVQIITERIKLDLIHKNKKNLRNGFGIATHDSSLNKSANNKIKMSNSHRTPSPMSLPIHPEISMYPSTMHLPIIYTPIYLPIYPPIYQPMYPPMYSPMMHPLSKMPGPMLGMMPMSIDILWIPSL